MNNAVCLAIFIALPEKLNEINELTVAEWSCKTETEYDGMKRKEVSE